MVSLEFFIDIILQIALWPWGRLSLKQKWVPGEFPEGKCGRCVRLTTLPPPCVVMKSGNRNFLEHSGPLQACNGTALPFTYWWRSSELTECDVTLLTDTKLWSARKEAIVAGLKYLRSIYLQRLPSSRDSLSQHQGVKLGRSGMGSAVEPGYNDIGLYDTSCIASDVQWFQLIPRC